MEEAKAEEESSSSSLRQWVVSFYEEHNPSKVGNVDALLVKYEGKEEELVRQLERKYGVVSASTCRDQQYVEEVSSLQARLGEAERQAVALRSEVSDVSVDRDKFAKLSAERREEIVELQRTLESVRQQCEREKSAKEEALRKELSNSEARWRATYERTERNRRASDAVAARGVAEAAMAALALKRKDDALIGALKTQQDLAAHLEASLVLDSRHRSSREEEEEETNVEVSYSFEENKSETKDVFETLYRSSRIQLREAQRRSALAEARAVELARERKEAREALAEATKRFEEASGSADATKALVDAAQSEARADALAKDHALADLAVERARRQQHELKLDDALSQLSIAAAARRELALFCRQQRDDLEKEARARIDRAVNECHMLQEDALSAEADLERRFQMVVTLKLREADDEVKRLSGALKDLRHQRDAARRHITSLEADLLNAAKRIHKAEALLKVVSRSDAYLSDNSKNALVVVDKKKKKTTTTLTKKKKEPHVVRQYYDDDRSHQNGGSHDPLLL